MKWLDSLPTCSMDAGRPVFCAKDCCGLRGTLHEWVQLHAYVHACLVGGARAAGGKMPTPGFKSENLPWASLPVPPPRWCPRFGLFHVCPCHGSVRRSRALSASRRCWPAIRSTTRWSGEQRGSSRSTVRNLHLILCSLQCLNCLFRSVLTSPRSRIKQSPLLKLLQDSSTSLARMLRFPLIWYNRCTVPEPWGLLKPDSTPPSCKERGIFI